jgi:shikimate kinase
MTAVDPLTPSPPALRVDRPIVLVGMMGVGKTSVGRRLASALRLPFHDADEEIEKAAGLSVTEIFQRHGETEFRRGERRVIERLLSGPPLVLATGGGAYMDATTRALLKEKAVTVWLRADPDLIWKRVNRRDTRPLLKRDNPRQVLADLLVVREPIYAEADLTIDSGEGPANDAVKAICEALGYA